MLNNPKRTHLIVYLYYNRDVRKLQKYGDINYHSRRMRYVSLYIDALLENDIIAELKKLKYVKSVRRSHQDEVDVHFVGNLADIAQDDKLTIYPKKDITLLE
ncbi:DUF2129 domain-containing protein [Streptococcus sp. zg-JUN1979]|uniref:DUF2129 domain-containing protein n=1 Tax=Streptococcus sp. zg-JUN1979 TaxID=3391450 RepID=UPI0039A76376